MAEQHSSLIHHFLENSARRYPDKVALIHGERRTPYEEINSAANRLAWWLRQSGVKKGDRVVLILENCLEYVISYYGVLKTGAVAVPLSTGIKVGELDRLLAELAPKIIITATRFERLLRRADLDSVPLEAMILREPKLDWSSRGIPVYPWEEAISGNGDVKPNVGIKESELASIIYTSGSTGVPKGVMLSHRNIVSNTQAVCRYLRLSDRDIQMVVLPFFYVMGKSLLNTHCSAGGTVVINNRFAYPASVVKQMAEERVTGFSGVPSTYAYLLHRSPLARYRDRLGSLRYCSQAGGHMSRRIKEELRRVLPETTDIYIMYGATEASARLTYLDPECFRDRMDSIGRPIPGVTLRVLDASGLETGPGEVGELVAEGPNIMQGYWKDENATSLVLDEHGYHTGDLGFRDADGFFHVVGRKDGLVKVGGHRINPLEIEDALMETGVVLECRVLGVRDVLLGNRLAAVVAPVSADCTPERIRSLCADRLPMYKVPGRIVLVKALPKNASGKIDRKKCIELIGNG